MKFGKASTYHYDMKHFGCMLKHDVKIIPGQCFRNVARLEKFYASLGRNMRIVLVYGGRWWDNGCQMGYHFLLQDADTGEYVDVQYRVYFFFVLHSWTPQEYRDERYNFLKKYRHQFSCDFFDYYFNNYKSLMLTAKTLLKKLHKFRGEGQTHNEREYAIKPEFGTQEFSVEYGYY